jgi:hypothetical protein
MALKTKPDDVITGKVNETVETVDTNGNNYLGTVPKGYRGATVMVTVNSGTATSFTLGKAKTSDRATPTVVSYENGSITATGGDASVNSGEGVDLYLVVAGASSLDADVEVDMFQ